MSLFTICLDFVFCYVTNTPERTKEEQKEEMKTMDNAGRVLEKCDGCHAFAMDGYLRIS